MSYGNKLPQLPDYISHTNPTCHALRIFGAIRRCSGLLVFLIAIASLLLTPKPTQSVEACCEVDPEHSRRGSHIYYDYCEVLGYTCIWWCDGYRVAYKCNPQPCEGCGEPILVFSFDDPPNCTTNGVPCLALCPLVNQLPPHYDTCGGILCNCDE